MKEQSTSTTSGDKLAEVIGRAKLQLERMIDLTPQMMLLIDGSGRVVRCNRSLLELLGCTDFAGALGRSMTDLFSPIDAAGISATLETRKGCGVQEIRCVTRAGQARNLRFTVINAGKDDPVRVVLVDDATGEKERAALVEQGHKREAIRALAGGLMHSLNQPLTVIMVKAAMAHMDIERGRSDEKALKTIVGEIMEETMKMSAILKKLGETNDYNTESYPGGLNIVKLEQ